MTLRGRRLRFSIACVMAMLLLVNAANGARTVKPFQNGDRVAFIGDSITAWGAYAYVVSVFYQTRFPDRKIHWGYFGRGGATAEFWSQEAGPQDPHSEWANLERVLEFRPTVATIMLGMNDSGYDNIWLLPEEQKNPALAEVKAKYEKNMDLLIARLQAVGVKRIILIISSPYDETQVIDIKPKPLIGKNAFMRDVFGDYLIRKSKELGEPVIDFMTPMLKINQREQKTDPKFSVVDMGDRIHPLGAGHFIMGYTFLKAQGLGGKVSETVISALHAKVVTQHNCEIKRLDVSEGNITWMCLSNSLPFPQGVPPYGDYEAKKGAGWAKYVPFEAIIAVLAAGLPVASAQQNLGMAIHVYNPTAWNGPGLVEIPVGRLAAPGLVDWRNVRFMRDGREVPWSIREGRPHWKSRLRCPIWEPNPEDLIVFAIAVPPGKTARVDIASGKPGQHSALVQKNGRLIISYPDIQVCIDDTTGMLSSITAFNDSMLAEALEATVCKLPGAGLKLTGDINSCRPFAASGGTDSIGIAQKEPMGPLKVKLVSYSSNAAMTEANFVLDSDDGLKIALTYRMHACGIVEIESDERPWKGQSPWIDHALEFKLALAGHKQQLFYPLNTSPYYGFKDYMAAVHYADSVYVNSHALALETGEETINGRKWNRRLYFAPADKASNVEDLAAFASEGFAVIVMPKCAAVGAKTIKVSYPKTARAAADIIVDTLGKAGIKAEVVSDTKKLGDISLQLVSGAGIEGDGFCVRPGVGGRGVRVDALTVLGLTQAAYRIADKLTVRDGRVELPLIASNPAVELRAGGFGGGDFEVDFPYGSDTDWKQAFDSVIASGMNVVADLGMWSNWKMPVSYKYMPELKTDSPDAFDESSGTKFSGIDANREHGLKLLKHLHDRGVRVWQWIPIGCVPTTYAKVYPEAMSPGSDKIPCTTNPLYAKYIEAFVKELLETYPLDGIVMIRDDNGGICSCERCKKYVSNSRTKDPMWEQYLMIYDMLRSHGFKGDIAVYPYNDFYQPRMDSLLPKDLLIVGHGGGMAVLARDYERLGPMGDTWPDNLFAGFRPASSTRMKRLLSDRGSFWIGGAFCGTELPWESIGYFGWEPTSTVNSIRYYFGAREFGKKNAALYTRLSGVLERMWDINQYPMLPRDWVGLAPENRTRVSTDCRELLGKFKTHLAELKSAVRGDEHAGWFAHVSLFGTYFDYHLRRLEVICEMDSIVRSNKGVLDGSGGLRDDVRNQLIAKHREVYALADYYDQEAAHVPGNMMARTRALGMTRPFQEWVAGYDTSMDSILAAPQFAGTLKIQPCDVRAGQEFVLRVELRNTGLCPWIPEAEQSLDITGDVGILGLPKSVALDGEPVAFGDLRVIELHGTAPTQPGECDLETVLRCPRRGYPVFVSAKPN